MELTNVRMWENGQDRQISVQEALAKFPFGVKADREIFWCGHCCEPVLLAAGEQLQYFKHVPNDRAAECEERQKNDGKTPAADVEEQVRRRSLPLRICINRSGDFYFEIGFFRPPVETARCDGFEIQGSEENLSDAPYYSFDWRVMQNGTSYLKASDVPCATYTLKFENARPDLKKYWPETILGVDQVKGAFFDAAQKMIPPEGKAYFGKRYYLLTSENSHSFPFGVAEKKLLCRRRVGYRSWNLYEISVLPFEDLAKISNEEKKAKTYRELLRFFKRRGVSLEARPSEFYPVWPPYVEDSRKVYYSESTIWYYASANDELRVYPGGDPIEGQGKIRVIETVRNRETGQLLAWGPFGTLGVSYLSKRNDLKDILPKPQTPKIEIRFGDVFENILTSDADENAFVEIYRTLPKNERVRIEEPPYDGKAVVLRDGKIWQTLRLSAGKAKAIDVNFGTEIRVFQGCDVVRVVRFEREKDEAIRKTARDVSTADRELAARLAACRGPAIPAPHSLGAVAAALPDYRLTRNWIYSRVRKGDMPRSAYLLLIKTLRDRKKRETRR